MTTLELIGAAALYVATVGIAGYAGGVISILCARDQGLASIIPAIVIAGVIWVLGAIVGLVLLGAHL